MDLSELPNPYDFANPVSDPRLFAGRNDEMDEIRYYLDQGRRAPRPINLAIMGERASGKTSILNMIHFEAQNRGYCVVRVDLDEGDAQTQLGFFCKLFDAVVTEAAAAAGAYGGLDGDTYDTYRNMVDAYEIPEKRLFCPFLFPIQYAKAMNAGNVSAVVSDAALKRDLANIQRELNRPVAVLFDECDVLTKSRVHLQKLRNVFMNTPGFMLVVTGTPALFPLMDDVFSPIVRQFKKINVHPFGELRDTQDCVRKPLESVAIEDPSDLFDFDTFEAVRDIHDISGGRPYEIRLICHFLFRRVQEGRADRMRLTLSTLDDVRRELQTSQDVSTRPVISAVRGFDEGQLSALRLLCACNGRADFDKIWFAEYVFHGEKRWAKESLQNHLRTFEQMGVLSTEGGAIRFSGDDFDRIYCKYLARSVKVPLAIQDLPYEFLLTMSLRSLVVRSLELGWSDVDQSILQLTMSGQNRADLEPVAMAMLDEREESDPFQSTPRIAEKLYWHSIDFRGRPRFEVALVTITTPWETVSRIFSCQDPKAPESSGLLDLASILADPSARAVALGGDLTVATDTLPVIPIETLVRKVEQSGNARMRDSLFREHAQRMHDAYVEARDVEKARFHAQLAYRYDADPSDPGAANNLGYLFMVTDDLPRARKLLEKAATSREEGRSPGLAVYNLGIVEAKEGNLQGALAQFRAAIDEIGTVQKRARQMDCLVVPRIAEDEARLEFVELFQPDLLDTAQSAVLAVEELLRT